MTVKTAVIERHMKTFAELHQLTNLSYHMHSRPDLGIWFLAYAHRGAQCEQGSGETLEDALQDAVNSLSIVRPWYLSGSVHYITADAAREIEKKSTSPRAIARQDADGWSIYYLIREPMQPGQHPFELAASERKTLEARS